MASPVTITKRDGRSVAFDANRIEEAVGKAFRAAGKPEDSAASEVLEAVLTQIGREFGERSPSVEQVQDIVERTLVEFKQYEVAKRYIIYREDRARHREARRRQVRERAQAGELLVIGPDGASEPFSVSRVEEAIERHIWDLRSDVRVADVVDEVIKGIYDGVSTAEIDRALVLAASSFTERDPAYATLAARLFRARLYRDLFGELPLDGRALRLNYEAAFRRNIVRGVEAGVFSNQLLDFDLEALSAALEPQRDDLIGYLGIQTLHERYFARVEEEVIEGAQTFWMRVAMGLSINEERSSARAIEFYRLMSTLRFIPSTPTLFHSGLTHPQLSSCYLSTVNDDLTHIFKCIGDNAQMSKWSGGIGNDWSSIRATGSHIKSTKVESQGVIPFLKIANDTTVAINRSGKRRGATCAYLETWHLDIEDFLDLRRNTGDERRRTHDMNTANWIPDLFMKRVREGGTWTLFSPDEVPDLHDTYGRDFEERYVAYEREALAGRMKRFKQLEAVKLWRKMLTRLFETGHPWITFKDPSNIRSPQDHAGVVHNSNLCTEITLNNSADETAVCNLGSVNLRMHVSEAGIDEAGLSQTVATAMRMLDNVVDINFYPTPEAKNSNLRHRPVGLGVMGFQDALFTLGIPFADERAVEFADESMEIISYHAILASSKLAAERGPYPSYWGSKWERGIFPIDTIALLEAERGVAVNVSRVSRLDWAPVREHVRAHGMRNSNTMAIAPTATISNIAGSFPCIEPIYKNLYVKSNMSGEFTIVNHYLVRALKLHRLWNDEVRELLKYYDGSLQQIDSIPDSLKRLFQEAFEIDPRHLIRVTAARGKWIDQSQSHNVFMRGSSGKMLDEIYMTAWECGLKTTYYLRTLAASQIEKSTLDAQRFGYTQKRSHELGSPVQSSGSAVAVTAVDTVPATQVSGACSVLDPECESCQ